MPTLTSVNVPIDIWIHILYLSSFSPSHDEFGHSSEAFDILPRDENSLSSRYSGHELSQILKTRLTIVQVCRSWYDVGIATLWSHLRIQAGSIEKKIHSLESIIDEKPRLAIYVNRLTLEGQPRTRDNRPERALGVQVTQAVKGFLSSLPNLRILHSPFGPIAKGLPHNLEGAFIGSIAYHRAMFNVHPIVVSTWCTLRSLSLDFRNMDCYTLIPVQSSQATVFPQMQSLRIQDSKMFSYLSLYITEKWSFPILTSLSLSEGSPEIWIKFLEKCSKTVQALDISNITSPLNRDSSSRAVEMPELTSLSLGVQFPNSDIWLTAIRSNSIHQVSLHQVDFIETFSSRTQSIIQGAAEAISSFPSIQLIRIYELGQYISPNTRFGLRREDLSFISGGGVAVEVHYDVRGMADREAYSDEPCHILDIIARQHPELHREANSSVQDDQVWESRQWRSKYRLGKFEVVGELAGTKEDARNNAAARLIRMIRADVLFPGGSE